MGNSRLIIQHLDYVRNRLVSYSEHLNLANHPDVKGLCREGIIKYFLKENLPSVVDFKTGEIFDRDDNRSGQVDLVLQSAFSPRMIFLGDLQLTMVDFCLGAIEIKSTLTTSSMKSASHLKSALDTFKKIKALNRFHFIESTVEFFGNKPTPVKLKTTPCFLVAYKGPKLETLLKKLNEYSNIVQVEKDEYWPEVITVIDRGYHIIKDNGWFKAPTKGYYTLHNNDPSECLLGLYTYLTLIIEAWNSCSHPTQFQDYYKPFD